MNKANKLQITFSNIWSACTVEIISGKDFIPEVQNICECSRNDDKLPMLNLRFNSMSFLDSLTEEDSEMLLSLIADRLGECRAQFIMDSWFLAKEKQDEDAERLIESGEIGIFRPETQYEAQ
jgi:hypothetical protein